eukprot:TRINITY_DN8759_c0_g1_i1.p1 TRINITY_DN8759_c0_g1~~TRINITY_DN8759_c0_g1_i1.p1  ORF type:complete len:338 (-),score=43.76 TRINITY_DN8759_c0_g1_i1:24-1037(-)
MTEELSVPVYEVDVQAAVQLESLRNVIIVFERGVRWAEVKEDWHQIRPEWLESVRSCECVEDLFPKMQILFANMVEDQMPSAWKADRFKLELKRCTEGATAKHLIKMVYLCASSFENRGPGAFEALYTDLLQYLRSYVFVGVDIGLLFPQTVTEQKISILHRAMKRLEVGINWSGVLPTFRDLRNDWLTSASNATTLPNLVEVWKTFESFCNWENLGPSFIPLRSEWQQRLSQCQDEFTLARLMLEMESHCVPERLSGIYRGGDRTRWRAVLTSLATVQEVPSLKSICAKKVVVSGLPTEGLELPLDVLDLLDDMDLAYKLIAAGARDNAISSPFVF